MSRDVAALPGQAGSPVFWYSENDSSWKTIGVYGCTDRRSKCKLSCKISNSMMNWIEHKLVEGSISSSEG